MSPRLRRHAAVLRRAVALLTTVTVSACVPARPRALSPLDLPAAIADSVRTVVVAPGARLHTLVNVRAPWRAHVLDVDLACTVLRAVKGGVTAVGRTTTSGLLAALPAEQGAIAAINADFFTLAPPGVPTNLHVEGGAVLAGPAGRPLVIVRDGRVAIDSVAVRGRLSRGGAAVPLHSWNRPSATRAGIVDARWGVPLDSAVRPLTWRLEPIAAGASQASAAPSARDARYLVRPRAMRDTLATGDTLLLHQPARDGVTMLPLHPGDTVRVQLALTVRGEPVVLTDAVGGRPLLVVDSLVVADVDTDGNAGFRALNPRSLVGLDREGRRAWLVVVDGRQPGYSLGMTLRQSADLLRALGASQGINLDGGGSSALAVRPADTQPVRLVNRPSDPVERPVGNALAVYSHCRAR